MNFFSYATSDNNKPIDTQDGDELSMLADEPGNGANQPQLGDIVHQNKIGINSAVSSVVQLDEDSNDEAESITF